MRENTLIRLFFISYFFLINPILFWLASVLIFSEFESGHSGHIARDFDENKTRIFVIFLFILSIFIIRDRFIVNICSCIQKIRLIIRVLAILSIALFFIVYFNYRDYVNIFL